MFGQFVVAVNIANFKFFAGYRTLPKLSAVQGDAVIVIGGGPIRDGGSHKVVHNIGINIPARLFVNSLAAFRGIAVDNMPFHHGISMLYIANRYQRISSHKSKLVAVAIALFYKIRNGVLQFSAFSEVSLSGSCGQKRPMDAGHDIP